MAPPLQDTGVEVGAGEKKANGSEVCSRRFFTWEEIALRTGRIPSHLNEKWLVIDRKVYDISSFYKRHPGGPRVISHYAGQDATDAFTAFHLNKAQPNKYLNSLLIGELAHDQPSSEPNKNQMLAKDFRELRSTVEKMGLLTPNLLFFGLIFLHIILFDISAWLVVWYFGTSSIPFFMSVAFRTIAQTQMSWLQHDLGHLSVFKTSKLNHVGHKVVLNLMKGFPTNWWNALHFQHHAKPNCFRKDPDLNMHPIVFVLGEKLAREVLTFAGSLCLVTTIGATSLVVKPNVAADVDNVVAQAPMGTITLGLQKKKFMPYNYQHKYFFIMAPLLIVPFFQISMYHTTIKRKKWVDLVLMVVYQIWMIFAYLPIMEFKTFLAFYWTSRFLEAAWFIWVSQMNHIPMNIDYDTNMDWVSTQLHATCNVDQSFFNDWFTGHLNFQIEHHLFPTMPRHNFCKVAPLVKSLCAKYGISYQSKPLLTAFGDIPRSLKVFGDAWLEAYLHG